MQYSIKHSCISHLRTVEVVVKPSSGSYVVIPPCIKHAKIVTWNCFAIHRINGTIRFRHHAAMPFQKKLSNASLNTPPHDTRFSTTVSYKELYLSNLSAEDHPIPGGLAIFAARCLRENVYNGACTMHRG